MMTTPRLLWCAVWSWAIMLVNGHASNAWQLESTGISAGFSATRINEHFIQWLAFTRINTPWNTNPSAEYRLQTTLDFSAGTLGREGYFGLVGSAGPVFTLKKNRFPVELVTGISPTLLSRWQFEGVYLGMPFQLTSHAGFNFRLSRNWVATYRFDHMSNAGMGAHNPGLNLHSLAFAYRF